MSVYTNNRVERKNKDFKHQHLAQFKDKSLSGMITVLAEQFLTDRRKGLLIHYTFWLRSHISLYLFKITHHHWPTTNQWLYISKSIMHSKLIFHIHFNEIAFSWDQFSWFPCIWENL